MWKKIDVSSKKFNSTYEMIYWRLVSSSAENVVKESQSWESDLVPSQGLATLLASNNSWCPNIFPIIKCTQIAFFFIPSLFLPSNSNKLLVHPSCHSWPTYHSPGIPRLLWASMNLLISVSYVHNQVSQNLLPWMLSSGCYNRIS